MENETTIAILWLTVLIIYLIALLAVLLIEREYKKKERELKNQFLEKLNDHEKAVILTYINIKPKKINFKKNKKV